MRRLFLIVAVLCCSPTLASAATFSPASTVQDPFINAWLNNAETYWNAALPNCPNGILVTTSSDPNPRVIAAVDSIGGCNVELMAAWYPKPAQYEQAYWDNLMCRSMAHEYGHMLGVEHVADQNSLMYYAPSAPVTGCPSPVTTAPPIQTPTDTIKFVSLHTDTTLRISKKTWTLTTRITNPSAQKIAKVTVCQQAPGAKASKNNEFGKPGKRKCKVMTLSPNAALNLRNSFPVVVNNDRRWLITVRGSSVRSSQWKCAMTNAEFPLSCSRDY